MAWPLKIPIYIYCWQVCVAMATERRSNDFRALIAALQCHWPDACHPPHLTPLHFTSHSSLFSGFNFDLNAGRQLETRCVLNRKHRHARSLGHGSFQLSVRLCIKFSPLATGLYWNLSCTFCVTASGWFFGSPDGTGLIKGHFKANALLTNRCCLSAI